MVIKRFARTLALSAVSVLVIAGAMVPKAQATTLIFEPATGSFADFAVLTSGYGNRVTSTTQDGFKYDLVGGPTPNVVTAYGPSAGFSNLFTWADNYGDLHNVVFAQEPTVFRLKLIPDSGFLVTLHSFDMAGWPQLTFSSIASVQVLDQNNAALFSQTDVQILGSTGGPQHTHFSFPTGLTATALTVMFDSTTDGFGNTLDSDDVGIDNINFSQSIQSTVPEPTTVLLFGTALIGMAVKSRRRRS